MKTSKFVLKSKKSSRRKRKKRQRRTLVLADLVLTIQTLKLLSEWNQKKMKK